MNVRLEVLKTTPKERIILVIIAHYVINLIGLIFSEMIPTKLGLTQTSDLSGAYIRGGVLVKMIKASDGTVFGNILSEII